MSDDTDRMRRAYPNDPPITAKIKLTLEGVAIYSDIASTHYERRQDLDDSDPEYRQAHEYYDKRNENMRLIHEQIDALRERAERLRQALIKERNAGRGLYVKALRLHPDDLADDLTAPSASVSESAHPQNRSRPDGM